MKEDMKNDEYIICAAIYFKDGQKYEHQPKNIKSGFVICGRRHHNCYATASILELNRRDYSITQGFLTSKDNFVNRKEARVIAHKAGQIEFLTKGNPYGEPADLFSEDLY